MDTNRQFMVTGGLQTPATLDYDTLKNDLKIELTEQVNGFVRIGYLLKQARDTDILSGSEYENVNEFASKEFHLTKDVVSRYINICEKYSVGGNSDRLLEEYTEYGYAKLSEMLTLPDEIVEEITPQMTRSEIQDLKKDYREEQRVTPLETMVEQPVEIPEEIKQKAEDFGFGIDSFDTLLGKTLYLLCRDDIALLEDLIHVAIMSEGLLDNEKPGKQTYNALAPDGQGTRTVRVPQKGKIIVSAKDDKITLTNMRSLEKETWEPYKVLEVFNLMIKAAGGINQTTEAIYANLYGNPEVAPVQPVKTDDNLQKSEQNSKEQQKTDNRQRDDGQKAAEGKNAAAGEDDVLRRQNAASDGFINPPEEPEKVKIDPSETEIVDKEPKEPEKQTTEKPESRTSTSYDAQSLSQEELARLTKDLIKADALHFDAEPDDRRQAGAYALIREMESLVYHIRERKWLVVADCAREIARAAEFIDKMEDQMYEEKKRD